MKIFLSVGHSILKNGACTSADGTKKGGCQEYSYCKKLGAVVKKYLEAAGHDVTLCICPERKFSKSSEERPYKIQMENGGSYDLAAELHLNCYNGQAKGCEVFYLGNGGKVYAERVVNKLSTLFTNRGAKKNTNLYFLNDTKASAIMIESFFCDSASDYEKGKDVEKVGKLIAEGIHGKTIKLPETGKKIYRVQVGAYSVKSNAEKLKAELVKKGYPAIIVTDN